MLRRDFLVGGGSVAVATLASPSAPLAQASIVPPKIIDVPCHVFNATDLPVRDFVEKVMLPDVLTALERKKTSKFFVNLLRKNRKAELLVVDVIYRFMLNSTPTISAENAQIAEQGATLDQARIQRRRRPIEIGTITEILREIWNPAKLESQFAAIRESTYVGPTALEEIRARIRREVVILTSNEEYYRDWDVDYNELPTFAQRLYDSERPPNGEKTIGFLMRWVLRFTRNRFELVDELSNMHGGKLALMTPAMVDFDLWLSNPSKAEENDQRTRQIAFVNLMGEIAKRPNGPRVHGFVCFDPLRQALYNQRTGDVDSADEAPLKIAKNAIEKSGFVGVKLYPPMGFRPFLNRSIENKPGKFPDWIRVGPERLKPSPGAALDAALDALFTWCRDNNVPVMAHANNSNESATNYGARGSPDNWKALFKSKRADGSGFLNLRVNLAHFGGFEEAVYNPIGNETLEDTWEAKVLEIWKELPQAKLYADISYLNEILAPPQGSSDDAKASFKETLRKTKAFWKQAVVTEPLAKERLMYGTDWIMTGGEGGFPAFLPLSPQPSKFYPTLVAEFLDDVGLGSSIDRIMFCNAVDFLGLKTGGNEVNTRTRLEKFHAGNMAWLSTFD